MKFKIDFSKYDYETINKGAYPKFIFNINGEKYFFKMNDFDEEEKIYYHQDIIEVFSSHFFKAVGYGNYVEYFFAHYGPRIACASKSFLKEKDMREITLERILELEYANKTDNLVYDFDANLYSKRTYDDFYNAQAESTYKNYDGNQYFHSEDYVIESLITFCKNYKLKYNESQLRKHYREMTILDFFMCNDDRNWSNICFVIGHDKTLRPAPLFDNGYSFGMNFFETKYNANNAPYIFHNGFSDIGMHNALDNFPFLKNGGVVAVDIYELCQKDKTLSSRVERILNVDIKKLIKIFEQEHEIKLNKNIKSKITEFFESKISLYKKTQSRLNRKLQGRELE